MARRNRTNNRNRTRNRSTRQRERTARQQARQEKRSDRQAIRQDNRTRRSEGRQLTKQTRIQAKGDSGYWSPEGIAARGDRTAGVIGSSGQIVGQVAPLIMGAVTGGGSTALEGLLGAAGSIGQSFGDQGESPLQSFGGEVPMGSTGVIAPMSNSPMSWIQDNLAIVIPVGLGLGYFLFRPKKKSA